jgi:hypothetical protein
LHESVEKTPQLYSLFSYREADSLSFIVCPRDFQYILYQIKVSISDNKKLPDRLLVDDVIKILIPFSQEKMNELQLFRGDAVFIKGNNNRKTICIAFSDDTCSNDRIRINDVVRIII